MDSKEFCRKYLEILNKDFASLNLTRIVSYDEFYLKQYLDSVLPVSKSKTFKKSLESNKVIIDIGFGGGFPILPLAHIYPDKLFIGLEARNKKVLAVNKIASQLDLPNVHCYHYRIEDVLIDASCLIVSKAVASVEKLLGLIQTTKKNPIFFYKGVNYPEIEKKQGLRPETRAKWTSKCEDFFHLDHATGRYLVGFKNQNVPHGTSLSKNLSKNFINENKVKQAQGKQTLSKLISEIPFFMD